MTGEKMQLADWLDDLCVRFIINLPQEELQQVARICFQIEEAQWFYEDFIRPTDPTLPSLHLKDFCFKIFQHCPLTSAYSDALHAAAYQDFLAYKTRVPVRGAILLNESMDRVVLVRGWKKGASWSFPRGKINKDEDDLDCAMREVWEETGYDVKVAGLVPQDRRVHSIDVTMREQHLRMFVFRGVPLETHFEPQTRKEISKIHWYKLAQLPSFSSKRQQAQQSAESAAEASLVPANKLYMVAPFLPPLKKWINHQRKKDAQRPVLPEADSTQDVLPQLPSLSTSQPEPVSGNPTDELKRLLSVGPAHTQAPVEAVAALPDTQANSLLAMLRGGPSASTLAVPAVNNAPTTPLEQITSFAPEPQSPHHHQTRESPEVRRQAPPAFPLSPNYEPRQQTANLLNHLGLNIGGGAQVTQNANAQAHFDHAARFHQGHPFHSAQQPSGPSTSQHSYREAFQPQGVDGAIAHGPAAPKANQLPQPRLNNHTMGLLNAFRTPSQRPQTLHQNAPQPSAHSQGGFQTNFNGSAGPQQGAYSQADMLGATQTSGPPRSMHQNNLLGLFKSPVPASAAPAMPAAPAVSVSGPPRAVSAFVSQPQAQVSADAPSEPVKQRSTTLAMLTRTLPKSKAQPTPNGTVAAQSAVGGQANMPLAARETANQAPFTSTNKKSPRESSQVVHEAAMRPAMTILPRPESATKKISPSPRNPRVPPSPSKTRQSNAANFTILQRPSASPAPLPQAQAQTRAQAQTPTQAEAPPKPFQPQILRRADADQKAGPSSPGHAEVRKASSAVEQRDTLLALFSKGVQGAGRPLPGESAAPRPPSVFSGGSASPLPSDPVNFRSRIASNASVASNTVGGPTGREGVRSPVESKGFLLDYLNGVVKQEQHKGAGRSPF